MMSSSRICKHIHLIWIGDNTKRPIEAMQTWVKKNPSWTVHLWGNDHLHTCEWTNDTHIRTFLKEKNTHYLSGIADIMRYEILYACGGFYVDADATCIRPLEDWLFDSSFCAAWENEKMRPGLIANTFMYSTPQNPLLLEVIHAIKNIPTITADEVWKMTGPLTLTQSFNQSSVTDYTLWPSHYFLPQHYDAPPYSGHGHIFAEHGWDSTHTVLRQRAALTVTNG